MCLAGQQFPTEYCFDVARNNDPQDDVTVTVDVTDKHIEQAADEILDDWDRLNDDVMVYVGINEFTVGDEVVEERWEQLCRMLRDENKAFRDWRDVRHHERVSNRACDLAEKEWHATDHSRDDY